MHRRRRSAAACAFALGALLAPAPALAAGDHPALVRGPDVSSFQGRHVDWARVKRAGYDFAFVKATEGTIVDSALRANIRGLERAGLPYGAYDYAHTRHGPGWAARHFVHAVADAGGSFDGLPPVLDIEETTRSRSGTRWWIGRWARKVEQLTGRTPMIYTGRWFWKPTMGPKRMRLPLWISGYAGHPHMPRAWSHWTFWQYTNGFDGPGPRRVPGIGRVDVSVFNGKLTELPIARGRTPAPQAEPVPGPTPPVTPAPPAPAPGGSGPALGLPTLPAFAPLGIRRSG